MPESISSVVQRVTTLSRNQRTLILTPGPHGTRCLKEALSICEGGGCAVTILDSETSRLKPGNAGRVRGRATRLPFVKHSFDAILSFESLYSIRPPWTVLAEFHRVLVPDGMLMLFEPAAHGFFSSLRDKVAGPGKRIFSLEEVKSRLARGDYAIDRTEENLRVESFRWPAYALLAIKKENPVEPVPQYKTGRELIESRKKKIPAGEELP